MNNSSDLLDHRSFLVFGAARSGLAAANLLARKGKRVAVYDEAPLKALAPARMRCREMGVSLLSSPDSVDLPNGRWEILVLSPGIPATHPFVATANACGCLVRSELEIGYAACPAPMIAITGTNGKTTVTHLVAHLFESCCRPAVMGGNVGRALCDAVLDPTAALPDAMVVCEVSSFQLDTIERFAPHVACVLNITPDHQDRYGAMSNYAESKYQITANQEPDDTCVVNADDPICRSFLARTQARGWEFSTRREVARGAFLRDGDLFLALGDSSVPHVVVSRSAIPLPGMHNIENVLAALAIGGAMGLDPDLMAEGVRSFRAVPHRIEPVGEVGGVRFFNDSKATNLSSVKVALASFPPIEAADGSLSPRVVLIAGGRDKGAPWKSVRDLVSRTVKGLVALGEAGPVVLEAWGDAAGRTREAAGMAEAIEKAREMAEPGDVVLLSPGCASFDLYENYEQRGEHFRSLVHALLKNNAAGPTRT